MTPLRTLLEEHLPALPAPGFEALVDDRTMTVQAVLERTCVVHPPGLAIPPERRVVRHELVLVEPERVTWHKQPARTWNGVAKPNSRTRYSPCPRCGKRRQGGGLCRACLQICPECGRQKTATAALCAECRQKTAAS